MNFKELYERLIQTASSTVDNNIDTVSQEISDKIAGTYNIFNVPYDGMNDFSSGYAKGGQECYFINFRVNKSAVNDFIFDYKKVLLYGEYDASVTYNGPQKYFRTYGMPPALGGYIDISCCFQKYHKKNYINGYNYFLYTYDYDRNETQRVFMFISPDKLLADIVSEKLHKYFEDLGEEHDIILQNDINACNRLIIDTLNSLNAKKIS